MWSQETNEKLNKKRVKLNTIDSRIIQLIAERFQICLAIGRQKAREGLAVYDPRREEEVFRTRQVWGEEHGLSHKFIRILFKVLLSESKRRQRELLEELLVKSA